jgi:hypothetical protein
MINLKAEFNGTSIISVFTREGEYLTSAAPGS